MKLTFNNLCKFDRHYFDPEDYKEGEVWTRDDLVHNLATYVFDTDEQISELLSIDKHFGVKVMKEVMVKLKNRDHDT